MTYSID